jgi:hypothetical protein
VKVFDRRDAADQCPEAFDNFGSIQRLINRSYVGSGSCTSTGLCAGSSHVIKVFKSVCGMAVHPAVP